MNALDDPPPDEIDADSPPFEVLKLDELPLPAVLSDITGKIVTFNTAARELFVRGGGSLRGLDVGVILATDGAKLPRADRSKPLVRELMNSDGTLFPAELQYSDLSGGRRLWLIADISARRKSERLNVAIERQRWRSLRDEALERLAGGVAHEFNNFLAVILLQADMIDLQISDTARVAERCDEIRSVAREAAGVAQQLLAFGRRQSMNPTPTVLNRIVDPLRGDLESILGPLIDLKLELAPDLGVAFVDTNQIVQIVRILAVNAADAMAEGGSLTIRTKNIAKGGPLVHKTQSSGSYIQLEFIDTGAGMDAKTAEHVFEPFFSTKKTGRASGLGLATVYGIVKQSRGYIWVTSDQKTGTVFRMQFPRIDETKTFSEPTETEQGKKSLKPTVLLIDDDPSIVGMAANTLRRSGCTVIEANSGKAAVDAANVYGERIDLILVDHGIPDMSGSEIVRLISRMYPVVKVIFITGDPGQINKNEFPHAQILPKPFSLKTLVSAVKTALN